MHCQSKLNHASNSDINSIDDEDEDDDRDVRILGLSDSRSISDMRNISYNSQNNQSHHSNHHNNSVNIRDSRSSSETFKGIQLDTSNVTCYYDHLEDFNHDHQNKTDDNDDNDDVFICKFSFVIFSSTTPNTLFCEGNTPFTDDANLVVTTGQAVAG
mmetsp:Transcript_39888/g.51418  ORF Transcript_39888/g.51418 Transcript_39888/m.51418 type:complete len:157 (-) Transcript_39888:302-772(-)